MDLISHPIIDWVIFLRLILSLLNFKKNSHRFFFIVDYTLQRFFTLLRELSWWQSIHHNLFLGARSKQKKLLRQICSKTSRNVYLVVEYKHQSDIFSINIIYIIFKNLVRRYQKVHRQFVGLKPESEFNCTLWSENETDSIKHTDRIRVEQGICLQVIVFFRLWVNLV